MLETRKLAFDQRLPMVRDALARADIEDLVSRKLGFDATLDSVEKSRDWLALANESEFRNWNEIADISNSPALRSAIPEAAEVQDKVDLLKGVLQWGLERDFNDRIWGIRRDLHGTGEALVETRRSRRQIDEAIAREQKRFEELGGRVYSLAPRIEGMKIRVEDTLAQQRAFLQSIAVGELRAQKDRLDVYMIQARFALAAIYDVAANAGDELE